VAARLRRELQTEVFMVKARYGEFKVAVDGEIIVDAGSAAILGIVPSGRKIVDAVRLASHL
jgi:hypothetical protein